MTSLATAVTVAALMFVSGGIGLVRQKRLAERHTSDRSRARAGRLRRGQRDRHDLELSQPYASSIRISPAGLEEVIVDLDK